MREVGMEKRKSPRRVSLSRCHKDNRKFIRQKMRKEGKGGEGEEEREDQRRERRVGEGRGESRRRKGSAVL